MAEWRGSNPDIDWQGAFARIMAGEALTSVCTGRDGMPTIPLWYKYLSKNPSIASVYKASFRRLRRDRALRSRADNPVAPEVWEAILARIAAGETPLSICKTSKGMPSKVQYDRHCREDADYGARVREIHRRKHHRTSRRNMLKAQAVSTSQRREAFVLTDWGLALERLEAGARVEEVIGGPPPSPTWWQWRTRMKSDADFAERVRSIQEGRRGFEVSQERIDRYFEIRARHTARETLELAGLSSGFIHRRKRIDKSFRRRHEAAVAQSRSMRANLTRVERRSDEVYGVVSRAVEGMHPDAREEVRSQLILAVLEGELRLEDVSRVARSFSSRFFAQTADRRMRSFDAPLFDDGAATLADRLGQALPDDLSPMAPDDFWAEWRAV